MDGTAAAIGDLIAQTTQSVAAALGAHGPLAQVR